MVSLEPGAVDQALVRRMCALIRRRGPDDDGFHFGDRVGMGMRRLAIIDVRHGKQPMYNEDRTIAVVFNGEIYNYRELREDLLKRGHRLETSSDTECLVHLYEEYGDTFATHLRGMFAFAIWDDRRKRLLMGRDRLGIKPYYYWQDGNRLYFGSELKCLLAVPHFERNINLPALSDYFTYKYVPGPHTIYQGIQEIPPAHVAVWSEGALSFTRYWAIDHTPGPDKPVQYYAEGLRHYLEEAVRLHLVSEVPLGAFLSGGIDSSAIVAMMSRARQGTVKTFTIGFEDGQVGVDERPFARTIADLFETDHSEYLYENPEKQIADMLPAIVEAFDEPFADSSAIPNYMVSEAARKFVTVALSGTGGDELFAGYERYRGAMAAERYQAIPGFLRRGVISPLVRRLPEVQAAGLWIDRAKRFVEGADLPLAQRYQRFLSAFSEEGKDELFSHDVRAELAKLGRYRTPLAMSRVPDVTDPVEAMLAADQMHYLVDDELRKTDRLSMWHSLEVRVPFLDHKVVEFAAKIPGRYKLNGMTKKFVLIEGVKNLLPASILDRRKQGFSIPLADWLRGPLRDVLHARLDAPIISDGRYFSRSVVSAMLRDHEAGTRNYETQLWTLLMLSQWSAQYSHVPSHTRVER